MIARFGDFDLDTVGFRLMRDGQDLHLAKQPLDLLIHLISRRGELVTREDIHAALWGSSTFVDSEHGINSTIRKVRAALGDDPAAPKYIETVPRRGYRFMCPVSIQTEEPAREAIVPDTTDSTIPSRSPVADRASGQPSRFRFAMVGIGIASGLALAAAVLLYLDGHRRAEEPAPPLTWNPITKTVHVVTRLASDGKNIYWTEFNESGCKPWQVPIDGGDATPVPIPFPNAFVTDATQDGRLLLVERDSCKNGDVQGNEGLLWELTLASGLTRPVGGLATRDAAYSPDGRRIAFTRWDELRVVNRDGSGAHSIARVPGVIRNIHWSQDGKLLRFNIQLNAQWRFPLWEAEIESGKARPMLPEWSDRSESFGGVWTRSGDFVFGAESPGGSDLWRLVSAGWPLAGHRLQQLTRGGPLSFFGPVAIPGRSELAVVGAHKQGELERFDSRIQRFVPFLNGISAEMVDFSRDGEWVVYVTYPERELWRSRADGSAALQLTHGTPRRVAPHLAQYEAGSLHRRLFRAGPPHLDRSLQRR